MADDAVKVAKLEVEIEYKSKGNPRKGINSARKALKELKGESKGTTSKLGEMFNSIKRIATYRLLRTALKAIAQGFKEGETNLVLWEQAVGKSVGANSTLSQLGSSMLQLKNTLAASIMPLLQALTPIIQGIASAVVTALNVVNQLIRSLQGYSTYVKANISKNYDYAKSIQAVKKQLMGFDELNTMSDKNASSGGVDVSEMFKETKISPAFGKVAEIGNVLKDMIVSNLEGIEKAVMVAPLPLGILLAFTGNLAAGIPLIIAGVAGLGASGVVDWSIMTTNSQRAITELTAMASIGLFGLGVAMLCMGQIPLGLGLMVAGATGFATAATISDGTKDIKDKIKTLTAVVSGAALAIGAILFFSGASPSKGLGLMLAGATGLAASITINWDWIKATLGGIADWFQNKFQALDNWWKGTALYKFLHGDNSVGRALNTAKSEGLGFGLGYGYMYGGNYASGGIPPQGSMFVAGESGPEFVGNVGGRTAVYNSDQLANSLASANEGVISAIYQAVNSINSAIANQPTPSIRIGDRDIYQASERGRRTIGGSLVQGV